MANFFRVDRTGSRKRIRNPDFVFPNTLTTRTPPPPLILTRPTNMSRRRVQGIQFSRQGSRPIDKVLPNVLMAAVVAAQQTQDLVTAATACTALGIRWVLTFRNVTGTATATGTVAWAIIILRDGRTANTISLTAGANLYEPEQDVLAFGRVNSIDDVTAQGGPPVEGQTKTMRKLKIGDKITFLAFGTAGNETSIAGTIQLFCKF